MFALIMSLPFVAHLPMCPGPGGGGYPTFCGCHSGRGRSIVERGRDGAMKGPVAASGQDLRALARIVTDERGAPPAEGLAPSLLSDLVRLIGCDFLGFSGPV